MAPAGRHLFLIHHHRIRSLLLTFLAYSSFHASRKPPSIVKSVLAPDHLNSAAPFTSGWPPFDGSHGPHRLGELDLAFLSAYSAGMYLSGHAADRLDLRLFLAGGMLGSCVATAAFGFAYWLDVHRLWFFIAVQVAGGLAQSIGWPCVVAVVANWFGDSSNRGLIMGIWNSHTSVGNILGSVLASCVLDFGWGWSFVLPALLVGLVGVLILTFLVPHPRDLGLDDMDEGTELSGENQPVAVSADGFAANLNGKDTVSSDETGLLLSDGLTDGTPEGRTEGGVEPIGFFEAWRLPGVASYACCLFFSKLVAYTFLYWLPFYIRHTAVAGKRPTHSTAGILSIVFDIGGVAGGISAGLASDRLGKRAITSVAFLALSLPVLVLYRTCGGTSMAANTGLMCLCGFLINGPYSLITTAVSADLGLAGDNSRALATITAIIDGTGSVGAALGPLLTGYIFSAPGGWTNVFLMLIVSNSLAIACLLRTAKAEVDSLRAVSSAAVVDAEDIKTPSLEEESAMNGDSSSASRLLPPPSTALPKSLSEPADLRAKRKRPDLSGPPKSSPPCSECGKRFSSSKALFGHMRCHPEREWRGIHPPPPPQPPPPMMTGRAPFTPEEQQVAATLILLANSPSSDSAASGEIAGSAVIRSLSASFDGVLWRRRRQQMQESCKDARFLDLNLPPPLDSCEADGRTPSPLDLKLRL